MNKNSKILYLLLFAAAALTLFSGSLRSQDNWWKERKFKTESKRVKYASCKTAFVNIGDGLLYSNVYNIVPYFDAEVYLNILGESKGYYTQEQSKYILDGFLGNNPVASFKWRNSSYNDNYAFTVGKYKYKKNGYINTSTVSVSLKYVNDLWLIDQININ